ncbi:MAG: hypothetical protein ACI4JM_12545 [Oscillospiraceae bacterium]
MKKLTVVVAAIISAASLSSVSAFADENSVDVYVTVADANGSIVAAMENISVSDIDNDGAITVNDALYTLHEQKYDGGAEAGYASFESDYGLSLSKLWGTENGGSYGYCVNDAFSMSLSDTISDGDYINAFVYTDTSAWSDKYCFFDVKSVEGTTADTFTLTLSANAYDENWNSIVVPVENAVITFDGNSTEYVTDSDGKVTITVDSSDIKVISAVSDSEILVPPVCLASVSEAPQETENNDDSSSAPEETQQENNNSSSDNNDDSSDNNDDSEIEINPSDSSSNLTPNKTNSSSDKLASGSKNSASDSKNSSADKKTSDKKDSDSSSAGTGSKSPETGDKGIAGLVMIISAAGLAAICSAKKED